jgi:CBS domain containing-hemolysin-like protein
VVNVNEDEFGSLTEEVETLAGLLLEIKGDLPERREIIDYKQYRFQVLEADNRRILKVKYTLLTE